ncbi:4Fe-4S dicluster domain-containing protein [Thiobacter aerophilum]|uniref:4Fe-4S dicluster domain-containing protein n=1 Tax=Thiobacter aerophilum TaxID=3121275 RepID=A0ABV0EB78_9BURK
MNDVSFLPHARLDDLIQLLLTQGFRVIGPRVRAGVIAYDTIDAATQLPWGWRDAQAPGRYRLEQTAGSRCFAWANGAQAIKPFLFAPREPLWQARRAAGCFEVQELVPPPRPLAFLGVRACDLAALAIHDRHFLGGLHPDPYYAARGEEMLLIAVNCTHPADTCFCAATGDGPQAAAGFDLALTELDDGFVAQAGSQEGRELMQALVLAPATPEQRAAASQAIGLAAAAQTRRLPAPERLRRLYQRLDHSRWEDVGARCLSCGNCTQVCPTCFCHREQDVPALEGEATVHERQWDSCFSAGHAWLHGYQVRPEIRQRYRQWLTHKLAGWQAQFGRSGCVGCGRCISWCPVGIDLTEEVEVLLAEAADGA